MLKVGFFGLIIGCVYCIKALLLTPALRKVVVVGGGAAGYFGALTCASRMNERLIFGEVILLEAGKNTLTKVSISGGGRCNVLHDPNKDNYPRGQVEMLEPLSNRFSPRDTFQWFDKRGADLKIEKDGRVFPSSDQSKTIVQLLELESERLGVKVLRSSRVKSIRKLTTNGFCIEYTNESASGDKAFTQLECDRVILATGSARIGHEIMEKFGHTPIHTVPSLFSFKIVHSELNEMAGLSSQCAKVKLIPSPDMLSSMLYAKNDFTQRGPVLITKQGLSGPGILKLSAFAAKYLAASQYNFNISVSWLGDIPEEQVLVHLERAKRDHPTRLVGKYFPYLTPELHTKLFKDGYAPKQLELDDNESVINRRLWLYLLRRCSIDGNSVVWQSLDKKKLQKIAQEVTRNVHHVEGRALYKDEFVTCGGVSLKEVNMNSLESSCAPGVYLAGEVLDIDGVTGGFNFQAAWTTGFVAGTSCADSFVK